MALIATTLSRMEQQALCASVGPQRTLSAPGEGAILFVFRRVVAAPAAGHETFTSPFTSPLNLRLILSHRNAVLAR